MAKEASIRKFVLTALKAEGYAPTADFDFSHLNPRARHLFKKRLYNEYGIDHFVVGSSRKSMDVDAVVRHIADELEGRIELDDDNRSE